MRNILFIGRRGCSSCEHQRKTVIEPLHQKYPDNVQVHYNWDRTVARVNASNTITRIPLIVVECDGHEEFRYSGTLTSDELEGIILCDADSLSLSDVIDGEVR